ncbi:aldehyde dehydrogenase family protein [Halobellus rarus]|uniref:L-glutamate gamma-semialdehyde dehydrogenase n=1 Tax=Halobellus rarus TaxID=1126237 RepID=A0ABD6CRF4_9EURY|nr:aldehyde dehydrogenase family protein [Halobellus rarus]
MPMNPQPFENELTFAAHRENGSLDEFHRAYADAVAAVESELGASHSLWIDGRWVEVDDAYGVTSPADGELDIGRFAAGGATEVDRAVAAASDAFDEWRRTHWSDRIEIFRRAVDLIRERKFELAATLTLENGKNRAEAMADIDEGIDFLRFYARELERNDGYEYDTGEPTPGQHCTNALEPFGVFAVIGPFNFPFAIFCGMLSGALLTGNTAVAKPASATPLIAHKAVEILVDAGVPDGVVNLVTGSGRDVGRPLVEHEDVAGVVFTGSRAVGRRIRRTFFDLEKSGPVIAELGGKNPVIVTANADLEKAVSGVKNGAFGYSGQKCSATSRVYVDERVIEAFTDRLVEATEELVIDQPRTEEAFVSPLIDDDALERYVEICETARREGTVLTGGEVVSSGDRSGEGTADNHRAGDLSAGRFVEPTVVTDVPHDHELAREEHFVPFVTVHSVSGLDEAVTKANDSTYGLCAGLFTEDEAEIDAWFERIESGMCYVNREQSATTGALVQAQPFGGWKASGTTSKFAGGYWYLPQFLRERSRTVVGDVGRR